MRPETFDAAGWSLAESGPVETLTSLCFMGAAILSLGILGRSRVSRDAAWIRWFFGFAALASLFLAMEEIAWGQHLLGFATPEGVFDQNRQGETTFHNLGELQGRSDWMRLAFGIAAVVGLFFSRIPQLRVIAVSKVLTVWAATILAIAAIDAANDMMTIHPDFDLAVNITSEFVELLCGGFALYYMILHSRRMDRVEPLSH